MTGGLLSILIALGAAICSQIFMGVYFIFGLIGSANFGTQTYKRVLAKVGATIMVLVLAGEFWLFQVVSRPALHWRIVGVLLVALVLWSFFMVAFTDPGTPASPEWQAWAAKHKSGAQPDSAQDEAEAKLKTQKIKNFAPGKTEQCQKCDFVRPERSHHCKSCGTCVLRMDHHCPLIGNCIGWRNHKYYLLLQWWQLWGCIVFLFAPGGPGELAVFGEVYSMTLEFWLDFGVCWAAVVMLVAGRSFVVGTFMACRNETHIETHYIGGNPYQLVSIIDNLRQLLGPMDAKLLLPVKAQRSGAGTCFPTRQQPTENSSVKGNDAISTENTAPYGSV